MSASNFSDVMVDTTVAALTNDDLRPSMDIFVTVSNRDEYAVGVTVTCEDVNLFLREGDRQYRYTVQTPTEAGAGTEYTILDAVVEILETAGISVVDGAGFVTQRQLLSLGQEGNDVGELDASVCDDLAELEAELEDILESECIDWA